MSGGLTRAVLVERLRALVAEGARLAADPSLPGLRTWLQLSDDLLSTAFGSMDRFHLAWLTVGRPAGAPRGRRMAPAEEAAYIREVVTAKGAVLQASLDAVDRLGMPFLGEDGGIGPGRGMGRVPGSRGEDPGEASGKG